MKVFALDKRRGRDHLWDGPGDDAADGVGLADRIDYRAGLFDGALEVGLAVDGQGHGCRAVYDDGDVLPAAGAGPLADQTKKPIKSLGYAD